MENGTKLLKEEEEICDDTNMDKIENQQAFILLKAVSLQYFSVQYGNILTIQKACEQIIRSSRIFTDKYNFLSTWDHEKQCFNYELSSLMELIQKIYWWWLFTYQECTEFGYFETFDMSFTDNVPLDFFYNVCKALFGVEFDEKRINEGINRTNEMYGGQHPNVTKVVFVNGELDPWHKLSILEDLSPDSPAKVIPFASHCQDLRADSPTDPKELKDARKYIKDLVKKWIKHDETS
ncbi:putative serine protease K12H4.7 [Operophtera brumata]|uniref:Putative serine protease K12H4.7 n=1 Tax=Operophtera brumata TaxID=104452 RepID=A0A0L7LIC5_OPEBR|nr:putative serine protease K12H4.7 [Operophtera brumata]